MGIKNRLTSYHVARRAANRRLRFYARPKLRDLPTIYARHNRFTGDIVTGEWETICEYDKREWSDPVVVNRSKEVKPLTTIPLFVPHTETIGGHVVYEEIYSLAELVGKRPFTTVSP